jgi:hypothetical protein
MSSWSEENAKAARLKMLQLLAGASGYSANNELLQAGLAAMGIRLSSAAVRAELAFLEECGTVKLMDVGPLVVAELTERGLDVSKGLSSLRGIDRPVPGSGL